jgi:hypothetical protein
MALRMKNASVHSGAMMMLDTENAKVLSYSRKGTDGKTVVVALNFSAEPQTVTLGVGKVSTVMTDAAELKSASSGATMTLPGYGAWVGEVK